MITNFEEETKPLTKQEREIYLPLFLEGFSSRIGKENRITSTQIILSLEEKGLKIGGARVRKMINHIRLSGLIPCLVGTSKGYWISQSQQEITSCIESLRQREQAIYAVRRSLGDQLDSMVKEKNKAKDLFNQ